MGWQLEIGKMALYMMFPVGLFHYFNQPAYFENWVIKTKQEIYPPQYESDKLMFQKAREEIEEHYEQKMIEKMEAKKLAMKNNI